MATETSVFVLFVCLREDVSLFGCVISRCFTQPTFDFIPIVRDKRDSIVQAAVGNTSIRTLIPARLSIAIRRSIGNSPILPF